MTESFPDIIPVNRIKSCLEVHKIYIHGRRTDVYLSSGGDALSHHLLHYNIHLLVKTSYYMTWEFDELTYYFIIVYIKFENIF